MSAINKYFFCNNGDKITCLFCKKDLVSKSSNAQRHFESFHSEQLKNLTEEQIVLRFAEIKSEICHENKEFDMKMDRLKASYLICKNIAKAGKSYSEGEFWKMCAEEVFENCFGNHGKETAEMVSKIALSRQTVVERISNMSKFVTQKVKVQIESCVYFSVAIDESTDNKNIAQLMIFVKTINENFEICENLLHCTSLYGTTKGVDIFQAVKSVFDSEGINLSKLSSLTTDGAPAMMSENVGVVGQFKKHGLQIKNFHCALHQLNLIAKKIGLDKTMSTVVKIINKLKGGHNALQNRKFKSFLEEFGSEHKDVALFTEVRWLSRAKCLKRFFELRFEIETFLKISGLKEFENVFEKTFLEELAFLTDVSELFNETNLKMQGKDKNIFDIASEINGFKNKLKGLRINLNGNLNKFKCCNTIRCEIDDANFSRFDVNMNNIISQFDARFKDFDYILSVADIYFFPLICTTQDQPEMFQEELVRLQSDFTFNRFDNKRGIDFWSTISCEEYPVLKNEMLKVCSMFPTTYQCEAAFSVMTRVKGLR